MNNAGQRQALDELRSLSTFPQAQRDYLELALAAICLGLEVPLGKVLELDGEGKLLLVRAGIGWREGITGHATVLADTTSIAGYTLGQTGIVIFDDVKETSRFTEAHLLRSHDVRSSLATRISCNGKPWGVLTVHEHRRRRFSPKEIEFFKAAAAELGVLIKASASATPSRLST